TVVSRKILTDESACLMWIYLVMVVALLLLLLLWLSLLLLNISRLLKLDIVPDSDSSFVTSAGQESITDQLSRGYSRADKDETSNLRNVMKLAPRKANGGKSQRFKQIDYYRVSGFFQ
ncbi:unnamed protein product, partial [Heterotrigona itama]